MMRLPLHLQLALEPESQGSCFAHLAGTLCVFDDEPNLAQIRSFSTL